MSASLKKNSFYNILRTCSSIVFPLVTFPYISRVLQPENVGKINFASSFISYFSLIAMLGISTYAIRECAAVRTDQAKLNEISSQFFSINIITTVVSYVLLAICLLFWSELDCYKNLILIYSSALLFTTLSCDWLNTAMEDFRYITLRTVIFQFVALIGMFVFVKTSGDYINYALISIVASCGSSLMNIWYRKRYCKVKFTFNIEWRKHLPPILYLFVMSLSVIIFNNTDVTMLGVMWGDKEVGLYSTAHKVTNLIAQFVQAIIIVLIPRLSSLFASKDYVQINALLRELLSFNVLFGLPLTVGTIVIAKDIMTIVGGENFIEAAPILQIMILSFAFSLIGGSFLGNAILIPSKQEKYYMIVCLITAFCNVMLNYVFIPSYGAVAAAATTAFNGLLIFILLLFKVDKNIHIERKANIFICPMLGCLAIWVCCHYASCIENLPIRTTVSILASVVLYAIIVVIGKNDFALEMLCLAKSKFSNFIGKIF